ncbi:iron chaperone [Rummeliibacillus pycnus]|uniref:iron chaperone n=1 Tax=Rummeliibacillus pycnus TaxID=101070 RepID=UPI003D272522
MGENKNVYNTIDEYISQFPSDVQDKLQQLRNVIKEIAPDAEEKISYQMPAFTLKGNLVYFAAYKKHIGFYPTSSGITAFKDELSQFKLSKGTVQFPIDEPLPYKLISRMVKFRVEENIRKAEEKVKKKKSK